MIILAAPHALGAAQHAALSRQPQQCGLQQQSQWASAVGRNRLLGATSDAFQPRCRRRAASRLVTRMGIKAVEAFDGSFTLDPSAEATLKQHLSGHTFCKQVVRECQLGEGAQLEFSGILFQPVPWSVSSKRGMPAEVEQYADDPDHYTIINVPPNFMFASKIFKPSRLCAVYRRKH